MDGRDPRRLPFEPVKVARQMRMDQFEKPLLRSSHTGVAIDQTPLAQRRPRSKPRRRLKEASASAGLRDYVFGKEDIGCIQLFRSIQRRA